MGGREWGSGSVGTGPCISEVGELRTCWPLRLFLWVASWPRVQGRPKAQGHLPRLPRKEPHPTSQGAPRGPKSSTKRPCRPKDRGKAEDPAKLPPSSSFHGQTPTAAAPPSLCPPKQGSPVPPTWLHLPATGLLSGHSLRPDSKSPQDTEVGPGPSHGPGLFKKIRAQRSKDFNQDCRLQVTPRVASQRQLWGRQGGPCSARGHECGSGTAQVPADSTLAGLLGPRGDPQHLRRRDLQFRVDLEERTWRPSRFPGGPYISASLPSPDASGHLGKPTAAFLQKPRAGASCRASAPASPLGGCS